MLILTRKPGESLYIGDDIKITIVEIKGHQIRVGIDAPKEYRIYREEIYLAILEENRLAAETAIGPEMAGLEALSKGLPSFSSDSGDGGNARKKKSKSLVSSISAAGGKMAEKPSAKDPEVVVRRKRGRKADE